MIEADVLYNIEKIWVDAGYKFNRKITKKGFFSFEIKKEVTENIQGLVYVDDITIIIFVNDKKFTKYTYPHDTVCTFSSMRPGIFTLQEYSLLTKTFKLLNWEV